MRHLPKISVPPVSAECETTTRFAQADVAEQKIPWKLFRSGDGKTRCDYGDRSVISDPLAQHAILLDHIKKEACIVPIDPSQPLVPSDLQLTGIPSWTPPAPPLASEDLGKSIVEGHEAEGTRYTFAAPKVPNLPDPPALPEMQIPKLPSLPASPPKAPAPPDPPHKLEIWTATKLRVPLLTRLTAGFGQQISRCKPAGGAEPSPGQFEIPSGYKLVDMPKAPKPPAVPI